MSGNSEQKPDLMNDKKQREMKKYSGEEAG